MFNPRQRRRVAWVALFAILLNAFAPAVSRALAAQLGIPAQQLCTAGGPKFIDARDDAGAGGSSGPRLAFSPHCPFCAPHGAHDLAAPPAATSPPVLRGPSVIEACPADGVAPPARESSADARAPPAFSCSS